MLFSLPLFFGKRFVFFFVFVFLILYFLGASELVNDILGDSRDLDYDLTDEEYFRFLFLRFFSFFSLHGFAARTSIIIVVTNTFRRQVS